MSDLKPFTTDGCSGGMSFLWKKVLGRVPPWEEECIEHDRAYHRGGSAKDRHDADLDLAEGVLRKGYPITGTLMYYAVRVGGHPIFPLPWRWAYGREHRRGYQDKDSIK